MDRERALMDSIHAIQANLTIQHALIVYLRPEIEHFEKIERYAQMLDPITIVVVHGGFPKPLQNKLDHIVERHSNLHLHDIGGDFGRGAAMRAGAVLLHSRVTAFLDLDGEVPASEIIRLFTVFDQGDADVLIGDRWADGKNTSSSLRRVMSQMYTSFTNCVFRLNVSDAQSPLKVFRYSALERVLEHLRLFDHGFDTDLLYHCRRAALKVRSTPMAWNPEPYRQPIWPMVRQAFLSMMVVRLLNAGLPKLRFIEWLGRPFIIPVKKNYKILLFSWRDPQHPSAGGGEVYLFEQARHWVAAGHQVTWYAQSFSGASSHECLSGVNVIRGAKFPWVFFSAGLWYLFRSTHDYDFVIDCMNGIPFFTPLFTTKPKICLVYHVHSHHFREELPGPLASLAVAIETRLVPFIYRKTSFMTISESTKGEMEQLKFSRFPIELIHCGVSDSLVPGAKHARPTILYLGRLKKYKRVRSLIDAFVEIRQRIPEVRLVIAGTGDDEEALREYAEAKAHDIEFTGKVSDSEKLRLMQEAWVFGMPSSIEGWGIVVIEANSCGTPAVAYNVGGLRDCIKNGETGILADSHAEFVRGLGEILSDARTRDALSVAALTWAERFSWQSTAAITLQQIRDAQPWRAVIEPHSKDSWRIYPNVATAQAKKASVLVVRSEDSVHQSVSM